MEQINLFGSMGSNVLCTLKQSACPSSLKERYLWFTELADLGDEKCITYKRGWHGRMAGEEGRWGWIRWPHAPHQGVKVQLLSWQSSHPGLDAGKRVGMISWSLEGRLAGQGEGHMWQRRCTWDPQPCPGSFHPPSQILLTLRAGLL